MSETFHNGDVEVTRYWSGGACFQFHRDFFTTDQLKNVEILARRLRLREKGKKTKPRRRQVGDKC